MEVFCRNIPEQIKEKHLEKQFRPVLKLFGINAFSGRKVGRSNAILTIADVKKATLLLDRHGQEDGSKRTKPKVQLYLFDSRPIYLSKSRNKPEEFLLRSLADEERPSNRTAPARNEPTATQQPKSLFLVDMSCGLWAYHSDGTPIFVDCYRRVMGGHIVFGKVSVRIYFTDDSNNDYELEFKYSMIYGAIHVGGLDTPSITITGQTAPRLYKADADEKLAQQTQQMLALINRKKGRPAPVKKRLGYFDEEHRAVVATCFIYRFLLRDSHDILVLRKLAAAKHIPELSRWVDRTVTASKSYPSLLKQYLNMLEAENIPFRVKFQLSALVWNGDLNADIAWRFYPHVYKVSQSEGADIVSLALQRMFRHLPYPGPGELRDESEVQKLIELLRASIESAKIELKSTVGLDSKRPSNITVHKAQVTPCGIYLSGPNRETKNRVLRKYADYIDYFLRVEFVDETGDRVHFDPNAQLGDIFHVRYKSVLSTGIKIGDRTFRFLGFSHSSLRSQTCWFVAPFATAEREPFNASSIIRELGYFEDIRSPAKQAARIGQAFSDTLTSIPIPADCVALNAPDVERNGRVFSDGVGTISLSIMYKIWNEYALREQVKPTVFQIRILGRFPRIMRNPEWQAILFQS